MISPDKNPKFLEANISKKTLATYHMRFFELLSGSSEQIDFEDLIDKFGVSPNVIKGHLKKFVSIYPDLLVKISGFYPDVATIVDFAEKTIGKINSNNLMEANRACKDIVDKITKPKHFRFLSQHLERYCDGKNNINIRITDLIDLLYENYVDFIHETDNGIVSIVGRLNEEIFMRALANSELKHEADYKRTGQNSEADLIVFQKAGNRDKLYIEVKSYHARERLLRGLQDIDQPKKIGIGFFIDSDEFNPQRTATLLNSKAWAIYMPDETYACLEQASKDKTNINQHKFYRPLSLFVDDMVYFRTHGKITPFV